MKKLMLAFAATAALVSVASAEDAAWFTGTIGSEAGGSWTMAPGDGSITTNSNPLALKLEDAAASFEATSKKSISGSENLNFATSANFKYSYDTLPEVDSQAKAGVVVYTNEYYVLAKKESANDWAPTGIAVGTIDANVNVSVTISNGNSAVYAIYNIAGTSITKEVVAGDSAWGTVDYKGSGEVASLVGTTISLGYPIGPGHDPIPTDVGNEWATKYDIDQTKLAELLADTTTKYNGRTFAESCILGVGTNEDIKAEVADNAAATVKITVVCTPTIADRVKFALKHGDTVGEQQAGTVFTPAVADGIYQVVAYVDNAGTSVPASQEIGVKGASVDAETVYFIGAPWADCSIADLFKKTCCSEGDMVEIYDAESDSYKSWQFKSGAWEFADDQGAEPELIKKGQAVKYTTAAATTLYRVGNVSEVNTTPVVKGKWNLVASPKGSIAATALPLDTAAARIIQLGATGTEVAKTYLKSGDNVMYRNGYKGAWTSATEEDKVTSAFFVKPENAESVNW